VWFSIFDYRIRLSCISEASSFIEIRTVASFFSLSPFLFPMVIFICERPLIIASRLKWRLYYWREFCWVWLSRLIFFKFSMFKFGKATPPTNDVRKTPFFCEASTCDDHSAENCFRKHGARCQLCHGCHYKNVRCQSFIIVSISLRCLLGLQVGLTIRWSELSLQHMWADRGRKPLRPPLPTSTQVQDRYRIFAPFPYFPL